MVYLRTPKGYRAAIRDARLARRQHGNGLAFVLRRYPDGFTFSVWNGTRYIGPLFSVMCYELRHIPK